MDSITQIVLGAAVAEAALGKKIGNRAMVWGAIGGTIPDLDVLTGFWMNDLQRIEAHRGITHSLLFGFLFPLFMAWIVKRLYDTGFYKHSGYKIFVSIASILFVVAVLTGVNIIWYLSTEKIQWVVLILALILSFLFVRWIILKYTRNELSPVQATFRQWYWLFFLSIITHPILDAFTTYGTQLFLPFSNQRVSWNNISVLDPFYTVPFIICLAIALALRPGSQKRWVWNTAGLVVSCAYMALTFVHKHKVETEMAVQLERQHISYNSIFSTPTILNNRLWHCIALPDNDTCYQAFYSLKDTRPDWVITPIVRNQHLWDPQNLSAQHQVLRWFSTGLDMLEESKDGQLHWKDLRFASLGPDSAELPFWVFSFDITKKGDEVIVKESEPSFDRFGETWANFMKRQKGM